MNLYTLGPQPITFLDSDSDRINFSVYSYIYPTIYTHINDCRLDI
jgi:hypothetical protein